MDALDTARSAPDISPVKQRLIETVGRSARLKVLIELKRTVAGLAVGELAERLGMSYMGVKDLCTDLEKRGLLDTWRQPQKLGRPHMLYRLTIRAHELFPTASNPFTLEVLEAAQKLYGSAAAEKLLMVAFQAKAEAYQKRLRGDTLQERAESLAKLRESEGCMSDFEVIEGGHFKITEHHSPILDLLVAYPGVAKMEADLFHRVLGAPVRREESRASGLFCATFWIGG
jgi:predicted ArsR family transcriptional regulator